MVQKKNKKEVNMEKIKLMINIIFVAIGGINGQWRKATIYLPDSLSGILYQQAFAYNTI